MPFQWKIINYKIAFEIDTFKGTNRLTQHSTYDKKLM